MRRGRGDDFNRAGGCRRSHWKLLGAELSIEGVVVEDSFLTKKEKNAPEMIEPQVSKPRTAFGGSFRESCGSECRRS